jgi:hypothetical protein
MDPMHHRLRDGLSWCLCDQQAVFLDLPLDRYFRLGPDDDRTFQSWAKSGAVSGSASARLVEVGVLVAGDQSQTPKAPVEIAPASIDLGEEASGEAGLIDIGRGLLAQRRATSAIRRGKLASLVAALARDAAPRLADRDAQAAVRRIAAAFGSTPLAMRKARQCLPRALAAHALCRAAGALPTLVFGVRLEPFAAHCWLQWNAAVIVGDLEQARMFTPILAVP